MTLHVHSSNRAEALVGTLAGLLAAPTGDAFSEDVVVVHSRGLERWVAMQLADRLGICAGVSFLSPHELADRVLEAVLGEAGDLDAWSPEQLTWALMAILPDLAPGPGMELVGRFLDAGGPGERTARQVELSVDLARLMARYATYRPDLVASWTQGRDDGWQSDIWRALAERVPRVDPASLVTEAARRLDGGHPVGGLPTRVSLFTVGTLPPLVVRLLGALGRRVDLHLLLLSPSRAWWRALEGATTLDLWGRMPADDHPLPEPAHPLLASMGHLARDLQVALDRAQAPVQHAPDWTDPGEDTALHALQSDLLADRIERRPLPAGDRSLAFHSAHGPMRQVAVLRDVLLTLLDEDPTLQPRDILVMTPDMGTFGPLVRAVFADGAEDLDAVDAHPGGMPRLRFQVADRSVRRTNAVAEVLLSLLAMADGRLEANAVLDLLSMEPVRERFGIAPEDLAAVRAWVVESGIRWGRDGEHRADLGQPDVQGTWTWRYGLERLVLGSMVHGDDPVLGHVPVGEVSDPDERALLGGLVDFAETLFEQLEATSGSREVGAWREALTTAVTTLCAVPRERSWTVQAVLDELAALVDHSEAMGFTGDLDRRAVATLLRGRFELTEPGHAFLAGGITFCELVPMRSIPYRVVVLLGMDDGTFPRSAHPRSYDLVHAHPRLGDRSIRKDDRSLFLESLLSARDALVVLWSGRSVRDNRAWPPAVPVGELLDLVDATFVSPDRRRPSEHLVRHHPLQPFGEPDLLPGRSHQSFDRRMARSARAARQPPAPRRPFLEALLPPPRPGQVGLTDLHHFLRDPAASFCRGRLGLWLPREEEEVSDREPFDLDALGKWSIRDRLLHLGARGVDLAEGAEGGWRVRREGRLPIGVPGEKVRSRAASEARRLLARSEAWRGDPIPPVDIDLPDLAWGWRLVGRVGGMYGAGRLVVLASRLSPKHAMALWVDHLALCASGHQVHSRLVGQERRGAKTAAGRFGLLTLPPRPRDQARDLLAELLALYGDGQRAPVPFLPDVSFAWASTVHMGRPPARAAEAARMAWTRWGGPDPYPRLVWGSRCFFDGYDTPCPEGRDAEANARLVFDPLEEVWQ